MTSTLFVGQPPESSRNAFATTAKDAVDRIREGRIAVLPEGEWETVRDVLVILTGDDVSAQERVRLAKQGRLV